MKVIKPLLVSSLVSQSLAKTEIEEQKLDKPKETITTPIPNPTVIPEIVSYKNEDPESPKVHYVKVSRDGLSKEDSFLSLSLNCFLFITLAGSSLKIIALKNANNRISKIVDLLRKKNKFYQQIIDQTLKLDNNDNIDLFKKNITKVLLFQDSTDELTEILGNRSIV